MADSNLRFHKNPPCGSNLNKETIIIHELGRMNAPVDYVNGTLQ